jgi:hypothetical protein
MSRWFGLRRSMVFLLTIWVVMAGVAFRSFCIDQVLSGWFWFVFIVLSIVVYINIDD